MNLVKRCLWTLLGALTSLPLLLFANDYYNASGAPQPRSALNSADLRSEFAAIETGVAAKLPALSGSGSKLVRVNSGATGLEAFADASSFTAEFSSACTVAPTLGFDYSLVGHQVTLQVSSNGGSCTGNTTSFSTAAAALPAALRPTYVVTSPASGGFVNAGSGTEAVLRLFPDGTMSFLIPASGALTLWTASGSRGASYIAVSYVVP